MNSKDRDQIEFLNVVKISWSELEGVPDDQKAILAVLSFATNEVNCFLKIYLTTLHDTYGDEFIDTLSFCQSSNVLRVISSKLFEVKEALELGGKKKKTSDDKVLNLADEALRKFEEIEPKSGYTIARDVRNEVANHYSFTAARKNLAFVNEKADTSLYVHQMVGNSFFPMGDEVMFIGRLNRSGKSLEADEDQLRLQHIWFDWVKSAAKWLNKTNSSFHKEIILPNLKGKASVKKMYYLTRKMSSDAQSKSPLFLKVPKASVQS